MIHFVKYNLVGLMNTALTLFVVWVLHQLLKMNVIWANFLGYIVGGINSYWWNRTWNFKSTSQTAPEMLRFVVVFLFSYGVNLVALQTMRSVFEHLSQPTFLIVFLDRISPWLSRDYLANLVACVVYVLVSFGLYKKWVFGYSNK